MLSSTCGEGDAQIQLFVLSLLLRVISTDSGSACVCNFGINARLAVEVFGHRRIILASGSEPSLSKYFPFQVVVGRGWLNFGSPRRKIAENVFFVEMVAIDRRTQKNR